MPGSHFIVYVSGSIRRLRSHPIWRSNTQVSYYGSALAPSKVDTTMTDPEIKAAVECRCGYCPQPVPNPAHSSKVEEPCEQRYGGMCETDEDCERIVTLVFNLHVILRRHNILQTKNGYPFMLTLSTATKQVEVLTTFQFGEGSFFLSALACAGRRS